MAELEHPFMRAPYESLSKYCRNTQKLVEKESSGIQAAAKKLSRSKKKGDKKHVHKSLTSMVKKLTVLKRKLDEGAKQSEKYLTRTSIRARHIAKMEQSETNPLYRVLVTKQRLDRVIVDYLLREGHYDVAEKMVQESKLDHLVDLELFKTLNKISSSLIHGDCTTALLWCGANRSRLKKIESSLEIQLRFQEYIELLRKGDHRAGVEYVRTNMVAPTLSSSSSSSSGGGGDGENSMSGNNTRGGLLSSSSSSSMAVGSSSCSMDDATLSVIKTAMGMLAFVKESGWGPYDSYFKNERRSDLARQFRSHLLQINGLPSNSLLKVTLQSGLFALKTPHCGLKQHMNNNCPPCSQELRDVAATIPTASRLRSCIVCRITGEVMDEHNLPMALPNGNVYSSAALRSISEHHEGHVIDPKTGDKYRLADCQTVYVL